MRRIGLVVHPTRDLRVALDAVRGWAQASDVALVQLNAGNGAPSVAPAGEVDADDVVVAVGGDGTVLAALRTAAMTGTPVLGLACGSLGALTATSAEDAARALDDLRAGAWVPRRLPALVVRSAPRDVPAGERPNGTAGAGDGDGDGDEQDGAPAVVAQALNDVVFIRAATAQLSVDVWIDDELYVRTAGDGLIVATPLGASAYSMAAGGPLLLGDAAAFVCTPLAMHGGCAPPLVVPDSHTVTVDLHPGYGGLAIEVDGQRIAPGDARRFTIAVVQNHATLVTFEPRHTGLEALRRRQLVTDSPRVLARDQREARRAPASG